MGPVDDVFSPELVLVSPDLRARALAALPEIHLYELTAPPPRSDTRRELRFVLLHVAGIGAMAFATAVIVVLGLTLAADALR